MSMRTVAAVLGEEGNPSSFRAKIYLDSEWQEYRVRFYRGGTYLGVETDYYTDDKADAIGTAQRVVEDLVTAGAVTR